MTTENQDAGIVYHHVSFYFKKEVDDSVIKPFIERGMKLKDTCVKPDGKPYILSVQGGKQYCPPPYNTEFTHCLLYRFATPADRDYYLFEDPTHASIHEVAIPIVEKMTCLDFEEGVF